MSSSRGRCAGSSTCAGASAGFSGVGLCLTEHLLLTPRGEWRRPASSGSRRVLSSHDPARAKGTRAMKLESRPYGPDSTPEEIQAIRNRVSVYDGDIVMYKEVPVQSLFQLDLFQEKLEQITSG